MAHRILLALLAVALTAGITSSASADTVVGRQSAATATKVSTYDGIAVWSVYDPASKLWRLVASRGGAAPQPLPVAPRSVPFDVDAGPGPGDNALAAYSRCDREPKTASLARLPDYTTGRGCDVYIYDFATHQEQKLRGASTNEASETLPSVWRDSVAFARVYERRDGRRGVVPYLYVHPLTGGRSQRQPGGSRGETGGPGPRSIDLYGKRVGFSWAYARSGRHVNEVRMDTLGGSHRVVDQASTFDGGLKTQRFETIAFDAGRLYYGSFCFGDAGGCAGIQRRVLRYRITTRARERALVPTQVPGAYRSHLYSVSRDAGTTWYVVGSTTEETTEGQPERFAVVRTSSLEFTALP